MEEGEGRGSLVLVTGPWRRGDDPHPRHGPEVQNYCARACQAQDRFNCVMDYGICVRHNRSIVVHSNSTDSAVNVVCLVLERCKRSSNSEYVWKMRMRLRVRGTSPWTIADDG